MVTTRNKSKDKHPKRVSLKTESVREPSAEAKENKNRAVRVKQEPNDDPGNDDSVKCEDAAPDDESSKMSDDIFDTEEGQEQQQQQQFDSFVLNEVGLFTNEDSLQFMPPPASKSVRGLDIPPCVSYSTEEIEVLSIEPPSQQYILRQLFEGRLKIRYFDLGKDATPIPVSFSKDERRFELAVVKFQKSKNKDTRYDRFECHKVKAYYVAVSGFDLTTINLQQKLEEIADFGMEIDPFKIAKRLELLVTPASLSPQRKYVGPNAESLSGLERYPYLYKLSSSDVTVTDGGHMESGLIAEEVLVKLLGPRLGKTVAAITVRLAKGPAGIAKGTLVKSPLTTKIELTDEMIKVRRSRFRSDDVYLLICETAPSANSKSLGRQIHPQTKSPESESQLKPMRKYDDLWHLLYENGVPERVLEGYIAASEQLSTRRHGSFLGVADPTRSLPEGVIYLPGTGVVMERNGRTAGRMADREVFITRFPCTEEADGVLLPCIRSKPPSMTKSNWDFLQRMPFGLVVFASPSPFNTDSVPLPTIINDGDLDGDKYTVFWDEELLQHICRGKAKKPMNAAVDTEDDLRGYDFTIKTEDNRTCEATVSRKIAGTSEYVVTTSRRQNGTIRMTRDDILSGRDMGEEIISHRGNGTKTEFLVRYRFSSTNEWYGCGSANIREFGPLVWDYVEKHSLDLKSLGCTWLEKTIREARIVEIQDHSVERNSVLALWEDGIKDWQPVDEIRAGDDDKRLLVKYARDKRKLQKKWPWLKELMEEVRSDWLARTQEYMVQVGRLYEHHQLTAALHSARKRSLKRNRENGIPGDDEVSLQLGRAYKRSNDIQKHGGTVGLPQNLWDHVKNKSVQKYLI